MARTSVVKVGGLLLAGVVAIATMVVIWRWSLEYRRWSRLEQRMDLLRAEADARFCPRPILHGQALPGNAWEDYLPAIDLVEKMEEYSTIQMVAVSRNVPTFEWIQGPLEKYALAVDGMQRGTRRADVRRVGIHQRGTDLDDPWPRAASTLGELALCRCRLLASEGKTRDAVELLLDVCKYAQDLSVDGSEIAFRLSHNLTNLAFIGADYLFREGGLSAKDCGELADGLGLLDATFPRYAHCLLGRLEYFGSWTLKEAPMDDLRHVGCKPIGMTVDPGWREAYSLRLMKAAAFEQTELLFTGLLSWDEGPISADAERRARIRTEHDASNNVFFKLFTRPEEVPDPGTFRDLRARLRLLRLAAHWRATGEFLELDDPHGTTFTHAIVPPDKLQFSGHEQSLEIPLRR